MRYGGGEDMAMVRDFQRSKVYAAEGDFLRWLSREADEVDARDQRLFDSIYEVREYVYDLIRLRWFKRRWGDARIEVEKGRVDCCSSGGPLAVATNHGVIRIAPKRKRSSQARETRCVFREYVVLHELAHALKYSTVDGQVERRNPRHDPDAEPWHGRDFCKRLLELVGHQLGLDARRALRRCFKERRVKVRGCDADAQRRLAERRKKELQAFGDRTEKAALTRRAAGFCPPFDVCGVTEHGNCYRGVEDDEEEAVDAACYYAGLHPAERIKKRRGRDGSLTVTDEDGVFVAEIKERKSDG